MSYLADNVTVIISSARKYILSKLLVISSPRQILNEGKDLVDSDIDCK